MIIAISCLSIVLIIYCTMLNLHLQKATMQRRKKLCSGNCSSNCLGKCGGENCMCAKQLKLEEMKLS